MSLKGFSSKVKNSSQPNIKVHSHLQRTYTFLLPLRLSVNITSAQKLHSNKSVPSPCEWESFQESTENAYLMNIFPSRNTKTWQFIYSSIYLTISFAVFYSY